MRRLSLITAVAGGLWIVGYALIVRPPFGLLAYLLGYLAVVIGLLLSVRNERDSLLSRLGITWGLTVGGLYTLIGAFSPGFSWPRVWFGLAWGTVGFLVLIGPAVLIWTRTGRERGARPFGAAK